MVSHCLAQLDFFSFSLVLGTWQAFEWHLHEKEVIGFCFTPLLWSMECNNSLYSTWWTILPWSSIQYCGTSQKHVWHVTILPFALVNLWRQTDGFLSLCSSLVYQYQAKGMSRNLLSDAFKFLYTNKLEELSLRGRYKCRTICFKQKSCAK